MAFDPTTTSVVLRIFIRAVSSWMRRRALSLGIKGRIETGGVAAIQRFGSAANLNLHFPTLMIDGVYQPTSSGCPVFHPVPAPTERDVAQIAAAVWRKVTKKLVRLDGKVGADGADCVAQDEPLLGSGRGSCFLLGPRQTGESTLVRSILSADAWTVDPLEHDTFMRLTPGRASRPRLPGARGIRVGRGANPALYEVFGRDPRCPGSLSRRFGRHCPLGTDGGGMYGADWPAPPFMMTIGWDGSLPSLPLRPRR